VETAATALEQKIRFLKSVSDAALLSLQGAARHLPPSVVDRVHMNCVRAFCILQRSPLSDQDLAELNQLSRESEELLSPDGRRLDWLETQIQQLEKAIQDLLSVPGPPRARVAAFLEPWLTLDRNSPSLLRTVATWDTVPLFPGQYPSRDQRAQYVTLIYRFAALQDIASPVHDPRKHKGIVRAILNACTGDPDLARIRSLMEQLEQDVYVKDIVRQIRDKSVEITPRSVDTTCFVPVHFEISFTQRPALNLASARSRITVQWDTGKGFKDGNWEMWRYFERRNSQENISARFVYGTTKKPICGASGAPVVLSAKVASRDKPADLVNKEKWIDRLRFGLIIFTAALCVQTARQALPSLDVLSGAIGIFALGFGADAVKNLLTAKRS
jgi:hypothetical protein